MLVATWSGEGGAGWAAGGLISKPLPGCGEAASPFCTLVSPSVEKGGYGVCLCMWLMLVHRFEQTEVFKAMYEI